MLGYGPVERGAVGDEISALLARDEEPVCTHCTFFQTSFRSLNLAMTWTRIDTAEQAARFLEHVGSFHDSCLHEAHILSEHFVGLDLRMGFGSGWETRRRCPSSGSTVRPRRSSSSSRKCDISTSHRRLNTWLSSTTLRCWSATA